jgi:eukaryotic-like serine/threonine-protein kinase
VVGRTLAHYTILAPLGSGGMGEVYLAEDQILNRRVALKVLPRELNTGERRARFAREATTLAALNHPNIVTVHSVEDDGGIPFITMELIEGRTLADELPREGFTLDRFFDIAIPIADAVAAAHQHGIVHRDLKPGNVMVTADGRVKVLDFGLAKAVHESALASAAGDAATAAMTESGVIVGTWKYMSPEQARGQPVDSRSDIFALGVVFYEMLTGRRPFTGNTPTEVVSSIIKDSPPAVSAIRSGIPRELARIVRRCLAKDPARRIQSALDIRNELEELKCEIDSGQLEADVRPAERRLSRVGRIWPLAAGLGLVALGGLAGARWWEPRESGAMRLTNPRQVTFTTAAETDPAWSPDLGRIAYVSDQNGTLDIWITPASGGAAVNLTADHAGDDRDPAWSPDGNQIAFVSQRDGGGIYVMPAIGGRPIRVSPRGVAESLRSPVWAADGSALAHMRREPDANFIEIISMQTRDSRRLRIPGEQGNRFYLSWSPDSRFFAYVRATNERLEVNRLWVIRVADGQAQAVTDGSTGAWSPRWSPDSRTLYFISNRGGTRDLWQQQLTADGAPQGDASPLTVGVGMQHAALSGDGRKLAYSRGRAVANVWRVPILDNREAGWDDAEQLTSDEAFVESLDMDLNGERLVISSDRGGSQDLWLAKSDGTDMRQITADRGPESTPRFSPDGRHIAFNSYRRGNYDIFVVPTDGGPAVQLTHDPMPDQSPAWSPDGGMIAFYGGRDDGVNAFVVPATGGETRRITKGPVSKYFPQWSPDGEWMYFASDGPDRGRHVFRMPEAGGAPEQVTRAPVYYWRWSLDGSRAYFPGLDRGDNNLWALRLADGRERRLTHFTQRSGSLGELALAASRTHLYFAWRRDVGDIWVMDVVADDEP